MVYERSELDIDAAGTVRRRHLFRISRGLGGLCRRRFGLARHKGTVRTRIVLYGRWRGHEHALPTQSLFFGQISRLCRHDSCASQHIARSFGVPAVGMSCSDGKRRMPLLCTDFLRQRAVNYYRAGAGAMQIREPTNRRRSAVSPGPLTRPCTTQKVQPFPHSPLEAIRASHAQLDRCPDFFAFISSLA